MISFSTLLCIVFLLSLVITYFLDTFGETIYLNIAATLYFDENEKPFVQKKIEKKSLKKKKDWLNGGLMHYVDEVTTGVTEDIELHLPENTLQIEYNVDLN